MPDGSLLLLRVRRSRHLVRGWLEDVTDQRRIESALRHAASHDALTGLPNRRTLMAYLKTTIAEAARRPASLVFIDLDGFKEVNDLVGHSMGDAVLCHFADILKSQTQAGELAARIGGDEFVLILRGCPIALARARVNRLRRTLGTHQVSFQGKWLTVRASAGSVALRSTMTAELALAAADRHCSACKARAVYHGVSRHA